MPKTVFMFVPIITSKKNATDSSPKIVLKNIFSRGSEKIFEPRKICEGEITHYKVP